MVNEEPMVDAEQRVFRRITGRFVDDELERRFRSHFFSVRSRWFRRFCLLVMLGGLVLSAFYVHNVVRGLNEVHFGAGWFGNFHVVGPELAHVSIFCMLLFLVAVTALVHTSVYNERTQNRSLAFAVVGLFLCYGWPVIGVGVVRTMESGGAWASESTSEAFRVGENCSGADTETAVHTMAFRAFWHAGVAVIADTIVVTFSTESLATLAIVAAASAAQLGRAWYTWLVDFGAGSLPLLIGFHLIAFAITALATLFACRVMRQEWLMRMRLQQATDERIEQLGMEKERLDYERAIALTTLARRTASPDEAHGASAPAGVDQGVGGNAGVRDLLDNVSLSISQTTCSELACMAADLTHMQQARSVSGTAAGERGNARLYSMLPQYYHEVKQALSSSPRTATSPTLSWMSAAQAKSAGLLARVDAAGRLLTPGGSGASTVLGAGDSPIKAIFVLDAAGDLLLTTDFETGRFHHSSFVAGAPVAAAGEMTIQNGKLLSLSNRSGHYTPQRSSLGLVLERLRQLGSVDLKEVEIEQVDCPPATMAESFSEEPETKSGCEMV